MLSKGKNWRQNELMCLVSNFKKWSDVITADQWIQYRLKNQTNHWLCKRLENQTIEVTTGKCYRFLENQTLQGAFGNVTCLSYSSFLLITLQFAIRLFTRRGKLVTFSACKIWCFKFCISKKTIFTHRIRREGTWSDDKNLQGNFILHCTVKSKQLDGFTQQKSTKTCHCQISANVTVAILKETTFVTSPQHAAWIFNKVRAQI